MGGSRADNELNKPPRPFLKRSLYPKILPSTSSTISLRSYKDERTVFFTMTQMLARTNSYRDQVNADEMDFLAILKPTPSRKLLGPSST